MTPQLEKLVRENRHLQEQVDDLKYQLSLLEPESPMSFSALTDRLNLSHGNKRIISLLLSQPGKVFPYIAIATHVDAESLKVTQVRMVKIRRILAEANSPITIENVWGVGYRASIAADW